MFGLRRPLKCLFSRHRRAQARPDGQGSLFLFATRTPLSPARWRGSPVPRTRATDSSRQGVPRRVRRSWWLRAAAIPRRVALSWRNRRISDKTPLLSRIRFQVLPVTCEPGAERNVSNTFALAAFVVKGVAGAFPDGFPLPLRHSRHDVQHQPSGGGAGVERLGDGDQGDAAALEALQQLAQVLDAAGERRISRPQPAIVRRAGANHGRTTPVPESR